MIKCEKGNVSINGAGNEVIHDLSEIISRTYSSFSKAFGEEKTKQMIFKAVNAGMGKAEKFNLYADTLYGMCRKAQDTVPEANVCFECKAFSSEKSGTYRTICVGITTTEGSRKYYYVCEALRDMEENFVSVKAVLNNLLLNAPCPYCEKEKEN